MRAVVYEDRSPKTFGPLTALRAQFELRCGAVSLLDKLRLRRPAWDVAVVPRRELADVVSERLGVSEPPGDDGTTLFLCGRVVVDDRLLEAVEGLDGEALLTSGGTVVGALVERGAAHVAERVRETGEPGREGLDRTVEVPARVVGYPWELVRLTAEEIGRDAPLVARLGETAGTIVDGARVVGRANVSVGKGSVIAAGAVLDATDGPIVIGDGATVMSNAVIYGPASVGERSVVKAGARICGGSSLGEVCKVGGEVSACVFQGWANKQHEGFLGNSYVGSWVNIGAATDNSDLKNTYEPVRVRIDGKLVDTGQTFVGATIGDHSKTAIGTKLNTGTVVGIFCNVLCYGFPPKELRAFSWGTGRSFAVQDVDRAISTARLVMARRGVELSLAEETLIRRVFERARGGKK